MSQDPKEALHGLFEAAVGDITAQLRYLEALSAYLKKGISPLESVGKVLDVELKVMKANVEQESSVIKGIENFYESFTTSVNEAKTGLNYYRDSTNVLAEHLANVTPQVRELISKGQKEIQDSKQMEAQVEKKKKQRDKLQDEQQTLLSDQLQINEAKQQKLEIKLFKIQEKISQLEYEIDEAVKENAKFDYNAYTIVLPSVLNQMQDIKLSNANILSEGFKETFVSSKGKIDELSNNFSRIIEVLNEVNVDSEIKNFAIQLEKNVTEQGKKIGDQAPPPPPRKREQPPLPDRTNHAKEQKSQQSTAQNKKPDSFGVIPPLPNREGKVTARPPRPAEFPPPSESRVQPSQPKPLPPKTQPKPSPPKIQAKPPPPKIQEKPPPPKIQAKPPPPKSQGKQQPPVTREKAAPPRKMQVKQPPPVVKEKPKKTAPPQAKHPQKIQPKPKTQSKQPPPKAKRKPMRPAEGGSAKPPKPPKPGMK